MLYKDTGADNELDDIGQTSWVMLLHYLDELEQDKADEAELRGEDYSFILDKRIPLAKLGNAKRYRWQTRCSQILKVQ